MKDFPTDADEQSVLMLKYRREQEDLEHQQHILDDLEFQMFEVTVWVLSKTKGCIDFGSNWCWYLWTEPEPMIFYDGPYDMFKKFALKNYHANWQLNLAHKWTETKNGTNADMRKIQKKIDKQTGV